MKVCLVNINNCIDYSQYGPFLYEYIKSGEIVVHNSVNDSCELHKIYEKILAEFNRNAFGSREIKLLFIIPRNMMNPRANDYEFYNEINIYNKIISKLDIFSQVGIFYVDETNEKILGKKHEMTRNISLRKYTTKKELAPYLPQCDESENNIDVLVKAVDKIDDAEFRGFFQKVVDKFDPDMEQQMADQLMKVFSASANSILPDVISVCELFNPDDVADSLLKRLKILFFIKELLAETKQLDEYNTFIPDYGAIREAVATYRERLRLWYSSKPQVLCEEVDSIKCFDELNNARSFGSELDKMISEQFAEFDSVDIKDEKTVETVYEKLERLVENADEALGEFSRKDSDEYFNEANYSSVSTKSLEPYEITESYERELNKKLNVYEVARAPGTTERERLLRLLSDAKAKIEELYACRRVYFFSTFIITFLVACAGVVLLYFIAQRSVFMKEKTYYIFGIYSAIIAFLFFFAYGIMELRYKAEIKKLIMKSRDAVKEHLDLYKALAMEFEKNLNLMAKIACLREYLDEKKKAEEKCEDTKKRIEWHKKKTDATLRNIGHFDDFCNGAEIQAESKVVTPENYEDDAEHTDFYQINVF